eukprot:TRINITY_DN1228_c0_g5_i2.p2 TRINITY_DN1228_c0_g5~~TRINITY_DN1228_c0_g5_i2.p2  ORF type:complete len:107 (+),score=49.11 TRINITY_DN1228_c0_g5_i2:495-815(+)
MAVALVGNKCDLGEKRKVSAEEAARTAKEHGMLYIETSAKTGANVEEMFTQMAKQVNKKIEGGTIDPTNESSGVRIGTGTITSATSSTKGNARLRDEKKKTDKCEC